MAMPKVSPTPATPEDIAAKVEKLGRYVESLAGEVRKLSARIAPFAPEKVESVEDADGPYHRIPLGKPTLKSVAEGVSQVDRGIRAIEMDFALIRAKVDQISNSAWSRDEFKRYLDKPKK